MGQEQPGEEKGGGVASSPKPRADVRVDNPKHQGKGGRRGVTDCQKKTSEVVRGRTDYGGTSSV